MSAVDERFDEADQLVRLATVLARSLRAGDARLQTTLDAIVRTAADLSSYAAGLILLERGRLAPQAVTGEAPHQLDLWQGDNGTGPCLEAAQTQDLVRVHDMATELRWQGFAPCAQQLGVLSMLCVPLWIDDLTLGTLSLYSDRPGAFGLQDERVARVCATLAAVTLASAQQADQLRTALESRDVIGQAKGILMERGKLTTEQAFATLADVSQRRNRKLLAVAEHLVETGQLLGE